MGAAPLDDSCTNREVPVDVGHFGVHVERENHQECAGDHEGGAADKLEEVDADARGTHHDGFDADEADQ